MFITRRNQAVPVIADDLEYKSLLGAPNHVESNDLIIDLYLVDRDLLRYLFVDRLSFSAFRHVLKNERSHHSTRPCLYLTNGAGLRGLLVSIAAALGVIDWIDSVHTNIMRVKKAISL